MTDDKLPQRTLSTTFWLAAFFITVFGVRGELTVSFGLAIGAAIGLFSLWSLLFVVPRLVSHHNPFSKFLLGMVALMKLPIYAGVLYFAMSSRYISPFAVFVGAALVPAVIVLKVLGNQLIEGRNPVPVLGED